MDPLALIGPIVGLIGVFLGWLLATGTARKLSEEERNERRRSELLAAVIAYWHELERLEDELRPLPPVPERPPTGRRSRKFDHLARALAENQGVQALRWIWGMLLRRHFAREALDALDSFKRASRPLLFVGAPAIEALVVEAVELVAASPKDRGWWQRWDEMKKRLLMTARLELGDQLSQSVPPSR
jgi:hypothetical protein